MTEDPQSDDRAWYADGLRFECTQCGNCCTGPPGAVWFDADEGKAMATALGVSEDEFSRRYARRMRGGRWSLIETRTDFGYDCVFLDRTTAPGRALCRVYKTRPSQCRTWPFWEENLESETDWENAKRLTPCPGIDQGQLIPVEEIVRRLNSS